MSERELLEATAAEEGWTEATHIDVLIQYLENQNAPDAFMGFLIGQKCVQDDHDDPSPAESFIWNLADYLQNTGITLEVDFQKFCANVFDTMTIERAAGLHRAALHALIRRR